jgi:hypothetical protein
MRWPGFRIIVAGFLTLPLWGQAFPPNKGEIDLALGYQYLSVRNHSYSHGEARAFGHIRNLGVGGDVTFGLTDCASIRIGLPLVLGKYVGQFPHPNSEDDGTYHAGFSDFNASFRYNLTRAPLFLTPEFTAIVPSHDYVTFAHSAIGRDLREFRVGINAGRRLDPFLPRAVVSVRGYYSFVERILGFHHNIIGGDWEFDYILNPHLIVLGLGTFQYTQGGIEWPCCLTLPQSVAAGVFTPEQVPHHDQILATRYQQVGGGLSVPVGDSLNLYGSVLTALYYENGHRTFLALNLGVSYTFRPKGR